MNIEDILKGPQRRTKPVRINGLPDLIITELTAAERWEVIDNMPGQDDESLWRQYITKHTLHSLLGFSRNPTDAEIKEYAAQYGYDVIELLWVSLLQFSAIDQNAVENAKKP